MSSTEIDLNYLVDESLAADITSDAIDCRLHKRLIIEVLVDPANDPVADLYLQASVGNSVWGHVTLEEVITNDETAITLSGNKIVINDPAATAMILIVVSNLSPYMRLFFDRTAGGANQIDAAYWLEPK